ncbi:hypothetical protein EDB19DRAFT_504223 [Suillus lakei]|nr:hypothetical protein EDB19DRAFT_504223 [Suillus lakei]
MNAFDALKVALSQGFHQALIVQTGPPEKAASSPALRLCSLFRMAYPVCGANITQKCCAIAPTNAIRTLQIKHASIRTLDANICSNPQGSLVPPEWLAVYDGDYDDVLSGEEPPAVEIDTVYVLTVYSDEEESFEEHPIQEMMDGTTKLIGHGPQWWMSCHSD